MENRTEVTEF
ncbi:hypothetical protein H1C71_008566, partial [Ictidomys tridecemlineatus]|uniref:Uncharacterized protein n=2 Tax=Rodentia TaxID=9989 RepID=A0A286XFJ6_CAVPO